MRVFISLFCSLVFLLACKSEKSSAGEDSGLLNHKFLNGVWVANEGNFTFGNASISHVQMDGTVINDAFQKVNGLPVGDVLQSVNVIGDYLFLVVNNSGKIHVCDRITLKLIKTITGFVSPRYIARYNESYAVVSDLYDENLAIVNLNTLEREDEIKGGHSSEKLLVDGNLIFTNTWVGENVVRKIKWSPGGATETWTSYFETSPIDIEFVEDKIWVACLAEDGKLGSLAVLEPRLNAQMVIDTVIEFQNSDASPNHLTYAPSKNQILFLASAHPNNPAKEGGVFAVDPITFEISEEPIVARGPRLFYTMEWSEENGRLYLTDAKDYLSPGALLVYNFENQREQTAAVGIIPGNIFIQ